MPSGVSPWRFMIRSESEPWLVPMRMALGVRADSGIIFDLPPEELWPVLADTNRFNTKSVESVIQAVLAANPSRVSSAVQTVNQRVSTQLQAAGLDPTNFNPLTTAFRQGQASEALQGTEGIICKASCSWFSVQRFLCFFHSCLSMTRPQLRGHGGVDSCLVLYGTVLF